MQQPTCVQLEIDNLLFGLTCCVNDLQHFRRQLSIDDIQQVDLSLQKLAVLITNVRTQSNPFRLAAV